MKRRSLNIYMDAEMEKLYAEKKKIPFEKSNVDLFKDALRQYIKKSNKA